jgi:hypothetical protein
VAKGLAQAAVADTKKECHIETPSYAFTLPNLTTLPVDFRKFLEKDIIETSTLRGLEASGLCRRTLRGVAGDFNLCPVALRSFFMVSSRASMLIVFGRVRRESAKKGCFFFELVLLASPLCASRRGGTCAAARISILCD